MALSNAERQRRYQERKRTEAKFSADKADFAATPFHEFMEADGNSDGFEIPFLLADIAPPTFDDDRGPNFPDTLDGLHLPTGFEHSIGRAELTVACLLDAAATLAGIINRYKKQEISRAMAKLEDADLSDPTIRKHALAESARLSRLRAPLDKKVRWTLPQWKVKGED